jgi:hypothetical protein
VLVGYLVLAPPVLVFAPFAGLLLLAGPRTVRGWLWLLATGVATILWLNQSGGLAGQFTRAAAVLLTGTFLALTLWRPSARFSRALVSTAIAGLALVAWMWHLGVGWSELQHAVEQDLWSANRDFIMRVGQTATGGGNQLLDEMSTMARTIAALYPALLSLAGVAGLRLAWAWHHRIAQRPLGDAPAGFASFEFSDQLVWGWVVGLALCLLPLPPISSARPGRVFGWLQEGARPRHSNLDCGRDVPATVCDRRPHSAGPRRHLARFPAPAHGVNSMRAHR